MKLTNAMAWMTAAVVVLGAGGCQNHKDADKKADNDIFKEDGKERVTAFIDAQSANGARNDAMLYPQHFNGGQLNSLGRAKVLLMIDNNEASEPVTVHLVNCGEGDLYAKRQAAVEMYLKTAEGPNMAALHPSAGELSRLSKTESGTAASESAATDQAPAAAGGASITR